MHRTKVSEFKYLVVALISEEKGAYQNLFCDSDTSAAAWTQEAMMLYDISIDKIRIFKDVNYLLNMLVKNIDNYIGQALYDIYIADYPDGKQKDNVIKFWNENKQAKQNDTSTH